MSDLQTIKELILKKDLVPKILKELGCDNVKPKNNRYEARLPNGNNIRSVQVYLNKNLTSAIRSRAVKGDIFTIVSYIMLEDNNTEILKKHLPKAKTKICEILGLNGKEIKQREDNEQKEDPNAWIKEIEARRKNKVDLSKIEPNIVLPNTVLNEYVSTPYLDWIKEGISYTTQKEFGIGIDLGSHRVTIPIHNRYGELIGVKGRLIGELTDDNPKYLYLYNLNKSIELFNLHRALDYIQEKGEVLVFEAEKSVMKCWTWGIKNAVSIMGSDISRVQAEILKRLGLDVKIILCYDKDKTVREIKHYAKVFDTREVYGMYDKSNLLSDKDAPVDKGYDVFMKLYKENVYKII
jgi:DNA primase